MVPANSYLYLSRHNIFYFRAIIPPKLHGGGKNREYRKSLQTRCPLVAKRMSRSLRALFERYYEDGGNGLMEWKELKRILDQHLLQLIAQEKEHIRKNGPRSAVIKKIWTEEDLPHYKQELYNISHSPDSEDFPLQISSPIADEILKKNNIDLSDNHELFVKFCDAILRMYIEYNNKRIELNDSARSFSPVTQSSWQQVEAVLDHTEDKK